MSPAWIRLGVVGLFCAAGMQVVGAQNVPVAAPANGAGQPAVEPSRKPIQIALLPFRPLRSDAATDWIGDGIRDALMTDLSRFKQVQLREIAVPAGAQGDDTLAVLESARRAGVDVVVLGTFQTTAEEVRAMGQVLLASGRRVAVVSAKSTLREVFQLQDELTRQVREVIVGQASPTPSETQPGIAAVPPAGEVPANGVGAVGAIPPDPANAPATPVPFPGSALEQALRDEAAGREPWDGTASSAASPPEVAPTRIGENAGGWGTPGTSYTGGYWGGGYWGGRYMPWYPPPRNGGSGAGAGAGGPGNGPGGAPGTPGSPTPTGPSQKPALINPFQPGAGGITIGSLGGGSGGTGGGSGGGNTSGGGGPSGGGGRSGG